MIGTKAVYNAAHAVRSAADARHRLSLFELPAEQRHRDPDRRAGAGAGAARSYRPRRRRLDPASVKLLLDKVAAKNDNSFFDRVTVSAGKWDEKLDKQADPARSEDRIHPQAVARAVGDLAKPDAIFVLDTGLNTLWSANWIRQSGSQRIIGSFNNAAVGTALGSGQRHPSARSIAPGNRALRRWRLQHADVRIPDRRSSQAAGQGGDL